MTPYVVIGDSKQREEWLELRRNGIGASDTPSILGVPGAWGSPMSVAVEKLSQEAPTEMSEWQEAGLRMEETIARWAVEEINKADPSAAEPTFDMYGLLIQSTDHPWMFATPDAVLTYTFGDEDVTVPLQIKNTIKASDWNEGPPPAVITQCLHEQIVMGAPFGFAATLLLGNRLRWGRIERCDYEQECIDIIHGTEDFWKKIQNRERIDVDGHPKTADAIRKRWPAAEAEKVIELDGNYVERDNERQRLAEQIKHLELQKEKIDNEFREAMKDASEAVLASGVVYSYKQGKRSRPLLRKEARDE